MAVTAKTPATCKTVRARQTATGAPPPAAERSIDLTQRRARQPKLPHEADESTGSTGGVPSQRVQQSQRDVQRGLQDTSRAPEADSACCNLKR